MKLALHAIVPAALVVALACQSQQPSAAATETEGDDSSGSSGETGSSAESGSTGEDDGSSSETTGGPVDGGPDRVGIFTARNNYFELDSPDGPLQFHFGAGNSRWGAIGYAVAGDFDGDGLDTIGVLDSATQAFHLADANDSDEHQNRGTSVTMTGVPSVPPVGDGEGIPLMALAGDWDGDGSDGVGVFHTGSRTLYLRNDPSDGPPDLTFALDAGFPSAGWVFAGDFDGDGDDEIGMTDGMTAHLRLSLDAGPPDLQFAAAGAVAIAADFDDDGVDTVATFDAATNTFHILDENAEGAGFSEQTFGHAEPPFHAWLPVAGVWQVPTDPVATRGFEWPEGPPEANGFDAAALEAALVEGASVESTLSVIVVRNGELVGERYYHGYDRHIATNVKSVTKSVMSALYGIALDQGAFASADDLVADHLPSYFQNLTPEKQSITLFDLLTMRGGLQWQEPGSLGPVLASDDFVEAVLSMPVVNQPGSTYTYSTGLTHVASGALTEATGLSMREFARENLFEPLGISAPRWDGSPEGYFVGGAELWLRPRDMARIGQLYLRDGKLDGQQILSQPWVEMTADPWIPESGGRLYGLWWRERPWNNYPANDSYFAWGWGGQFIFLFPSWDLCVVTTSKLPASQSQSGAAAGAIFGFVDNQILTAVSD